MLYLLVEQGQIVSWGWVIYKKASLDATLLLRIRAGGVPNKKDSYIEETIPLFLRGPKLKVRWLILSSDRYDIWRVLMADGAYLHGALRSSILCWFPTTQNPIEKVPTAVLSVTMCRPPCS